MQYETNRLILREWRVDDRADLIEGLNDLAVSQWLAYVPYPYTESDAEQWLKYCAAESLKGIARASYEFAIELKAEGKAIGGVSVGNIDRTHSTAGGEIWLNSAYRGHGYGPEAFGKRIEFAFKTLGLRRLENGFFLGNSESFRMQERFGYRIEGLRRQAYRCMADGKLKDAYITGLLQEDWIQAE